MNDNVAAILNHVMFLQRQPGRDAEREAMINCLLELAGYEGHVETTREIQRLAGICANRPEPEYTEIGVNLHRLAHERAGAVSLLPKLPKPPTPSLWSVLQCAQRYKAAHKIVRAVRILAMEIHRDGSATLSTSVGTVVATSTWTRRLPPGIEDPGFAVMYEDGFMSWSPTAAFEAGYTRMALESGISDVSQLLDGMDPQSIRDAMLHRQGTRPMYSPYPEMIDRIDRDFVYHAPQGNQAERYERIRAGCRTLAHLLITNCPHSRELSTALTGLDHVMMDANAAIARNERFDDAGNLFT